MQLYLRRDCLINRLHPLRHRHPHLHLYNNFNHLHLSHPIFGLMEVFQTLFSYNQQHHHLQKGSTRNQLLSGVQTLSEHLSHHMMLSYYFQVSKLIDVLYKELTFSSLLLLGNCQRGPIFPSSSRRAGGRGCLVWFYSCSGGTDSRIILGKSCHLRL